MVENKYYICVVVKFRMHSNSWTNILIQETHIDRRFRRLQGISNATEGRNLQNVDLNFKQQTHSSSKCLSCKL
jgi:hypothetical protein